MNDMNAISEIARQMIEELNINDEAYGYGIELLAHFSHLKDLYAENQTETITYDTQGYHPMFKDFKVTIEINK